MGVRSAVDLLKQLPLFAGVNDSHLQTLVFSSDELIVPAGRTVFEAGDPSTNALIIKQGDGVVIDPETGGVLALAGPGSMFGEQSLIAGLPRQVTLNAKTEIEAIVIEQSVFLRLCSEFPEIGIQVLDVLNRQLEICSNELSEVQTRFENSPLEELLREEED